MGNIGHEAHWPRGFVIIYCQRETLFLFRSYAPLQRERAEDEHEELIRDVSQRTGQPAEKKGEKSEPVTIFMNRRTADKDSCTSQHCDFSLGVVKTSEM